MLSVWLLVLSSVVYLATHVEANAYGCPGTRTYKNQSCITVHTNPKLPWAEAQKSCREQGGQLLQIRDAEMNSFVTGLLSNRKKRYWIGISDQDSKGLYSYKKGDPLSSYTNWRKREPITRPNKDNCVEMIGNRRGVWKTKPCDHRRQYICQRDFPKPETNSNSTNMNKWDDLKVTWGQPGMPGASYFFNRMPRSTQKALGQGFQKISDCSLQAKWRGSRYVQNNDLSLVLLYDINGYIAGIQTVVPSGQTNGYPYPNIQPPFIQEGENFYLTAYFVNPDNICTTGRSAADFDSQGTGTGLFVQNGVPAERNTIEIPLEQSALAGTKWGGGKCVPTMGFHYWLDTSADMNCEDSFPVFLMYNKGRLNAFGWAMAADLPSKRLEHPPKQAFPMFFDPVPKCYYNNQHFSTMHIFLTGDIMANNC